MKKHTGFTLIELLVSLGLGVFLIAGIFSVYVNSNKSQKLVEDEVRLIDNARFALETISFDLKHAGIYGTLNHESYDKVNVASRNAFLTVAGQCGGAGSGWVTNVERPVFAVDESVVNPYATDCVQNLQAATDIFEVRYVNRLVNGAALFDDVLYVTSDSNYAEYFQGDTPPASFRPLASNYQAVAKTYYIKNYTETAGDGIPSLHVVSLQPGPVVVDTLLLEGVVDMQLMFGLTATNKSTSVVTWEHPTAAMDWSRVIAARIWLVLQSKNKVNGVTSTTTYRMTDSIVDLPTIVNGYRRVMVSTAVRLRNMNTGGG